MEAFIVKGAKEMKLGFTTGSCAAASSAAATDMLLSGKDVYQVDITLPKGGKLSLDVVDIEKTKDTVTCGIIKDAGDDPDVTHGLKIYATVEKCENGIIIDGGAGIGRVTEKGLPIDVGKAAINPIPMQMITEEVSKVCRLHGYSGGIKVTITIPGGEMLAKKTFNPQLGIVGGISVLGTTGIVEPMSEQALVDTIKQEMKMRKEHGNKTLLVTPGNYGMNFAKNNLKINIDQAVKCSNFIGETLDFARYLQFEKILLIGHIGKLIKLAGGVMNTHSKMADCRMEIIAAHAALAGASPDQIVKIMDCITTNAAFSVLSEWGLKESVIETLKSKIQFHLDQRVRHEIKMAFIIFLDQDNLLMASDNVVDTIPLGEKL